MADTTSGVAKGPLTAPTLDAESLGVSLTVRDVRRSAGWYRDVLGFTIDREYERGGQVRAIALRAGTVRLLVTQDDGAKGTDRVKGEGFSMQLTTSQDVDGFAEQVKAAGGILDTEPETMWGARAFRLRDPDGFRFVVSSRRES